MKLLISWPCFTLLLLGIHIVKIESVAVNQPGHSSCVQKRSVISLPVSVFKFTNDIIVPVLSLINQTNTYLWFDFASTWRMPSSKNLNDLYTSFGRLKEKGLELDEAFVDEQRANNDRRNVYQYIEGFFNNFGLNGAACVKRAICEMSEAPLSSNGLLGKAIELILTPSLKKMPAQMEPHFGPNRLRRDIPPIQDDILEELDFLMAPVEDEYTEAYRRGRDGLCWSHYADCSINIFKMLNI